MAIRHDIAEDDQVFRGTDRNLLIDVSQPGTDVPEDITGHTWKFVIEQTPGGDRVLLTKDNAHISIADPSDVPPHIVMIQLLSADISFLGGDYWYYLERTNAGFDDVYVYGQFKLLDK